MIKQFLKPDWRKIVILLAMIGFTFYGLRVYVDNVFYISFLSKISIVFTAIVIFFSRFAGAFLVGDPGPEGLPNYVYLIGYVLSFLVFYIFSCLIIWVYNKLKKKNA